MNNKPWYSAYSKKALADTFGTYKRPLDLPKDRELYVKCGGCIYRIKQLDGIADESAPDYGNSCEGDGLDVFLFESGGDE